VAARPSRSRGSEWPTHRQPHPEVELIIGNSRLSGPIAARNAEPLQDGDPTVPRRIRSSGAPFSRCPRRLTMLDAATLEILEYLIADPEVRHLMLVGAYRDNEVSRLTPHAELEAIRKANARYRKSCWRPSGSMILAGRRRCATLRAGFGSSFGAACAREDRRQSFLRDPVPQCAGEEQLLVFDRDVAAWNWNLTRIRAKGYTDSVVDLMVGKLKRLSDTTQEALEQLACSGTWPRSRP